jgi:hypothetical protein
VQCRARGDALVETRGEVFPPDFHLGRSASGSSFTSDAISITGMDSTGMRLALANFILDPEDRRPVPTDTRAVRQADPEVIQKKL